MGSKNVMSPSNVIDQAFGVLFSGIKRFLDVGNTVCIQMPKRAMVLCFTIQKEIFFLPFRCFNKVYEALLRPPLQYMFRVYGALTKEGPSAIELLTGEKNPSNARVMESARQIRAPVLKAINKENNTRSQLSLYRKQLEKWKSENEKRTEEIYKISLEEKELMKAVASALRHLRTLKVKREKMSDSFTKNISNMINTGTLSEAKLLSMQKEIKKVDSAINENKNICFNLLGQEYVPEDDALNLNSAKLQTKSFKNDVLQGKTPTEAMQKVLSLVVDENLYLKNRLAHTHARVEEILSLSENIKKEIIDLNAKFAKMTLEKLEFTDLQRKLDREKQIFKEVEADRDRMRYKLQALDDMIKEEEEFLGVSDSSLLNACHQSYTNDDVDQAILAN